MLHLVNSMGPLLGYQPKGRMRELESPIRMDHRELLVWLLMKRRTMPHLTPTEGKTET